MPRFALGFESYALTHPGCGEALTDEYSAGAFTVQLTTTGELLYEPASQSIGFLERGAELVVTADILHLRRQPSIAGAIVVDMPRGQPVHQLFAASVEADGETWAYVQVSALLAEGWCASRWLSGGNTDSGLTNEPEHVFTLNDLLPYFEKYGAASGFDPQILAGIAYQETGFRNYRVHLDGTGHGLFGLDDGGLLPDFERWSGLTIGRGATAAMIPPELQIQFAALTLAEMASRLGVWPAVRAWHTGEGDWDSGSGANYEALIRKWIGVLFP